MGGTQEFHENWTTPKSNDSSVFDAVLKRLNYLYIQYNKYKEKAKNITGLWN